MTEMEMRERALTQWEEVNRILSRFEFKNKREFEELLIVNPNFESVREVGCVGEGVIYDFSYKNLDLTVEYIEKNDWKLSDNVNYWDNDGCSIVELNLN